jgi:hypothetical protein
MESPSELLVRDFGNAEKIPSCANASRIPTFDSDGGYPLQWTRNAWRKTFAIRLRLAQKIFHESREQK